MQTIEMLLSLKQNIFPQFFSSFFEFALTFEHFKTKKTLRAYIFPKLPTTKYVLRQMSKNSRLRGRLDRPHGKRAETLIQS